MVMVTVLSVAGSVLTMWEVELDTGRSVCWGGWLLELLELQGVRASHGWRRAWRRIHVAR